jgi:2-polyprenyl-3-methyl-5-hydroxy-6-metoxy-1,4-benzoquinol methylase
VTPRLPDLRWDHNAWYHRAVLRRVPAGCGAVLDVGCGAGGLATALTRRCRDVDALDRDPAMVTAARAAVPAGVRVLQDDVLSVDLPAGRYDAVVSVSALHHLPLETALRRMAAWLRPGGVLVAVALPRTDLPRELPVEVLAFVAQRVVAVVLGGVRLLPGRRELLRKRDEGMPVRDPELTVGEVRARAAVVLPGVRVRRLLFWRYLLVWRAPG